MDAAQSGTARSSSKERSSPGAVWTDTRDSLWEATAIERPALLPLLGEQRADVVIVGMGYLGLSCATHLAEHGTSVIAIDANGPGFGASGRNGGQVIPGLKFDPDDLHAMYGEHSEELIDFVGQGADRVFELISRYGMTCDPVRNGWIQAAHNPSALEKSQHRARQWIARGVPAELLDARQVGEAIGCGPNIYRGGWIDRRAGSVHPLNFALSVAHAAIKNGARLFAPSRAISIERAGTDWIVRTAGGGSVRTPHVVVATNAYSDDLWPRLKTTIVPAQSFQVATDPLPSAIRDVVLRDSPVVSDTRRLLHYYRLDAAGRFIMGGRGTFSDSRGIEDFEHIRRAVRRTFPLLARQPMRYAWAGRLAMTRDFLPHLHQPAPGVTLALGCNGRGIALMTSIGQAIASNLLCDEKLPFSATSIRAIPLHRLHKAYASLLLQYYKIRDTF